MSVYQCPKCEVTTIENRKGVIPACPRCKRQMVPRIGPGAIEEKFPEKAHRDSVFRMDIDSQPPPVIDPLKPKENPRKKK